MSFSGQPISIKARGESSVVSTEIALPRSEEAAMPLLPQPIADLQVFLRSAATLGTQVAFWRSKARLQLLEAASDSMRSKLLEDSPSPGSKDLLAQTAAYEEMLVALSQIAALVPFHNRVGILRRNLIPTFQRIFVLHHLCQAIVCRLRIQDPNRNAMLPAGSLLDAEAKLALRKSFQHLAQGWDKESWQVYDYL